MAINSKPWIATIYFYLISCICIITLIFAGIQGLQGLYSMIDPESNLNEYEWQNYADLDEYKHNQMLGKMTRTPGRNMTEPADETASVTEQLTDEQWQRRWEKYRLNLLHAKVIQGRRNLVYLLIAAVVCIPLFLVHWRFARRSTMVPSGDNSVDK